MLCFSLLFFLSFYTMAQTPVQPPHTPAQERMTAFEQRQKLNKNSVAQNIPFTSVGPTIMSGRITALSVSPKDPTHFYAAYASGGLWFTNNNGTSFSPIFDNQAVMSIGDVAVNWNSKDTIIWIGTGENNSSRSSYSGTGIYKSQNNGKDWQYMGLPESHHIGRIVLHPTDSNTVWVAALGHLYSPNKERGIYKTTDGGKTWQHTLFVNDNAGGIDLVMNPNNPKELYAAIWERTRRAWDFTESGEGSGIYKSTDGGDKWELMTNNASGFPTGEGVGRIGLAMHPSGTIYALLDNQFRRDKDKEEEEEAEKDLLTKDMLREMSKSQFLKLKDTKISTYLADNSFPEKYTAKKVMSMVKRDKIKPLSLVEYLEDANRQLFDTPVIGAEVYRSDDAGKTWQKTHEGLLEDIYYSYGYYFGQIAVAPQDVNRIYIMGVPILKSEDGGKTFKNINGDNVHVDHHALWVNPSRDGHLVNGNDGGVNISYDDGESWIKCNTPTVGQFYTVNVDMAKPYNIYGGLQDNGVWVGSHQYKQNTRWHQTGRYPYKSILGGDGMQIAIDNRNNSLVYTGYQFGNYRRINTKNNKSKRVKPKHELGERPLRFNWQTPIHLSSHNQDILYMGSQKLHRSMNKGDDFEDISDDLTQGGKKGDVAYGTLTCIAESPLKFGLLVVGSDDGLVHLSKDGGNNWTNISKGLPKDMWVSRVVTSAHEKSRIYIAMNGYRWDNFSPYLFVSDDYGKTWKSISSTLPLEPINVIKEDPSNEDLLYVGTDHGVYVSVDGGDSFMGMNKDLPDVAVHDLVIHSRDKDLVIGTHGRSIYIANVAHLQQVDEDLMAKALHLFKINEVNYRSGWGNSWSKWIDPSDPKVALPLYVSKASEVKVSVQTSKGQELFSFSEQAQQGINYLDYNLQVNEKAVKKYEQFLNKQRKKKDKKSKDAKPIKLKKADNEAYYLRPGTYTIKVSANGASKEGELVVKVKK